YILYVALGRLVNSWLEDPASAYVALAVVFSGLTTFVVYFLALEAYDRASALTAASLLAVSPLFWFYGSVGLTYAGEALGASTVAYFAFRSLRGSRTDAWIGAAYLGLAGGLRQSILLLLLPLWLGSAAIGVRRPRAVGAGLAIVTVAALSWAVPMVWLTGGLDRYLAASIALAEEVITPTSVMAGRLETTLRMSRHLLESVVVGLGPLALVSSLLPWYVRRQGWSEREWFLIGWTVTPVAVYTLVHFGQPGYVLTFLPALVILLAHVLITALAGAQGARPRRRALAAVAAVVLIVLVNGAFFVSARPAPRDFERSTLGWAQMAEHELSDWIFSHTAAALREHEAVVQTYVRSLRGLYRPDDTLIITELGNPRSYPWLRHAMYYLPEYPIYELQAGDRPPGFYAPRVAVAMSRTPQATIVVPAAIRRLVWFVDHWNPEVERPPGLEEIALPHGRYLYALPVRRLPLTHAGYTFIADTPRRARAER
ncbi:MAG: ArnT family glycosyltransferase, partial [Candidatus Rokuibacteriota bacterium]